MPVRPAISDEEARFDAVRRRVGFVAAPLAFIGILLAPAGDLSPEAHRLAAVATLTVLLWITEAIPLAAAALLGPALAVVLQVAPASQALAPFAHPLIFLFLGGFLLAEGLSSQGFDRRAALWLMARSFVAGSPARASMVIAVVAWGFSLWISNTATTAMMIPIALGLRETMGRALPDDPEIQRKLDRYVGGMVLFMAYAASIGGVATPIGTAPNVIALGFLDTELGVHLDFFEWMTFALPISATFLVVLLLLSRKLFPPPMEQIDGLMDEVHRELKELGPLSRGEIRAVSIFGLAIAGWLAPSFLRLALGAEHALTLWAKATLHEGVVAIVCASLLFALPSGREPGEPLMRWERAHNVDWGTLFLLGGGIALGQLTFDTGLARALGEMVLDNAGALATNPVGLMAVATLLVIYLTEVTSNTATTNMMLPVLIGLAQASGMNAIPTALSVTLAASFAFMLPVSTPPNAMAYGTGLIRIDAMLRAGFWLDILGFIVLMTAGLLLLPLVVG